MRHEIAFGRRLYAALFAALAVLACAAPAPAQGAGPRKLSDYVNQFTTCNAGAHLDNLAIELKNDQTLSGYVVIYGPGGPEDQFGRRAVDVTKNYLVNTRGVDESRVRVVYGGRYNSMQELLTEVWVLPEGSTTPRATRYKPDLEAEGKFAELGMWDSPEDGEGWSDSGKVALVGLSDLMRHRAGALAYVVVYHDEESAPGAWRRAAERQAETLRRNGVGADRMKVVFGGYAEEAKVQLWILPADAKPPVRARRERRPERSVRVASLDGFQLKYVEGEQWAFNGLADVLKADGKLTGCVVVRLAPAEFVERNPDEPAEVDLVGLAERWKAELKKKHGVGEHRLIVMFAPTRDGQSGGELETWAVPPGAPLPDPSADEAGSVEEEDPEEF